MSAPIPATVRSDLQMNADSPEEKAKHLVRQLIWLYLWLLLFEGALRKWIVPSYSNPLLLIRDPVMLAIYFYSIRARVFPMNAWVISLWMITAFSLVASIISLYPYLPMTPILGVTFYGFRCNAFHLPLIFIMGSVFDEMDVRKFGWWVIVLMIPIGLLMAAQFQASPDSFINRTAGLGEAEQLTAGGGKIRPPGPFSFITGPVYYMSLANAFLIYGALTKGVYKNWLLITAVSALVLSVAVSGSRATVVSVFVVVVSVSIILLVRPKAVNQVGRTLVLALVCLVGAMLIARLPIFKEGVEVLSNRFTLSAEAAETTITKGMITRVFDDMTEAFAHIDRFPLFGYGIGVGTNVGGRILIGHPAFLLAESEWSRILAESGPILGLAFLLWRTLLMLWLFCRSLVLLRRGGFVLPIILWFSGFSLLLIGQLGQPTTLGFTAFVNGLCLAAMRPRTDESQMATAPIQQPVARPLPRRSVYANRLHGPKLGAGHTNGSADR